MGWDTTEIREGYTGKVIRTVMTCCHDRVVPVTSVLGEVVARLCLDCDQQFPVAVSAWPLSQ